MSEKVTVENDGHVMLIGINRPDQRNMFDLDVLTGLAQAYTDLSGDRDLRCAVVFGHGKHFSSGLDLMNVLPSIAAEGPSTYLGAGQCDPFGNFGPPASKPVICAVHGCCYTAGLELVLAADMCVACDDTRFGQMEVSRGIFPFGGATFRLPRAIGWHNAMRIMLAGDTFGAREAERFGLVLEVAPEGKYLEAALALANRVAAAAPLGVQGCLENARVFLREGKQACLEQMQASGAELFASEDAQEGMLSLFEKRPPVFKGK